MSPNRLAITVGFRANGEAVCLFCGEPEGAIEAFEKAAAGTDFVLVRAFRQLGMHTHPWKNVRLGDFQEGFDASSTGVSSPSPQPSPRGEGEAGKDLTADNAVGAEGKTIPVETPEPLEAADFEPVVVADEPAEEVDEAAELVGGATEPVVEAPLAARAVLPKKAKAAKK